MYIYVLLKDRFRIFYDGMALCFDYTKHIDQDRNDYTCPVICNDGWYNTEGEKA